MATKYMTDAGNRWNVEAKITPVEIEKETETSIWIKGDRHNKVTQYTIYHDTWEKAKAYLIEETGRRLREAKENLSKAEKNYTDVAEI